MKMKNTFGNVLKGIAFIAVIGILLLAIGVFFYSFHEIYQVGKAIFSDAKEGEVVLKALKAVDVVLLGIIFFITAAALYELFIDPIDNMPSWFRMENIDQLKAMLIKVVIVVMGVSFTGKVVTWDGETDLMGYGLGLGAVILSLSYFLKVKMQDNK